MTTAPCIDLEMLQRLQLDEALERFFVARQVEHLKDWKRTGMPAITLQCLPTRTVDVDIEDGKLREAFQRGGPGDANTSLWGAFRINFRADRSFDGLCSSRRGGDDWITRLDEDGYLAAGVWNFITLPESHAHKGPGVAADHANAFVDFAHMAHQVYEAAGYAGSVSLTATLHSANALPLFDRFGRLVGDAPTRETVRWPRAAVTVAELVDTGEAMKRRFERLYARS